MKDVTVYVTTYCPFCDSAMALLDSKGIPYHIVDVTDPDERTELKQRTGWMTVPQIFIGKEMIGGYQELEALEMSGQLDGKLA